MQRKGMVHIVSPFSENHYEQKYTVNTVKKQFNSKKRLDYVFFWSSGCFNQWYGSNFIADGNKYNCAEQYMMAQKALVFDDQKIFKRILSSYDPKQIKALGREVKGFNSNKWDSVKYSIVLNGNFYKFTQNEEIKEELISTKNKILVEASPYDKIWGIGLSDEDKNIENPNYWKGQNMLGFALMEVRDNI
jgi:ribA/ribD-fused uncharacterized protein